MAILRGTGFEIGSLGILYSYSGTFEINSTTKHTGTYSIRQGYNGTWVISFAEASEVYVSVWLRHGNTSTLLLKFKNDTSDVLNITWDTTSRVWKYGSNYGTISPPIDTWYNLQVHISIADSGGIVQTRIDGTDDIDFTGDTKTTAYDTVNGFGGYQAGVSDSQYFDDLTIADSSHGWIGDIRYDVLTVNGQDSVEWTPSSGSNYQCVDEIPPSDTDYVYTETDEHKDVYTLSDWDGSGKEPQWVVHWLRARKDTASGNTIEHVMDDGTESIGSPVALLTSFAYYDRILETPPSGGAWDETAIDNLKAGMRAQI